MDTFEAELSSRYENQGVFSSFASELKIIKPYRSSRTPSRYGSFLSKRINRWTQVDSKLVYYPSVSLGTTTFDYLKGTETSTHNLKFDFIWFLTHQVLPRF